MKSILKDKLICLQCHGQLVEDGQRVVCSSCSAIVPKIENSIIFYRQHNNNPINKVRSSDEFISRLKSFVKKYNPRFFRFLSLLVGAVFVGKSVGDFLKQLPNDGLVLNLGAGTKKINKNIINIDIDIFSHVDIVADAKNLPFLDNSVDAVICEFMLEHVEDPEKIIAEMMRVLKTGGLVYVTTPFIIGFHSCPRDYYRWTESGLKEKMKKFTEVAFGVCCGPSSAFVAIFSEWFAITFSFGIKKVYELLLLIALVIFAPLKLLDFIYYNFPPAKNIALGFYYIGKKI